MKDIIIVINSYGGDIKKWEKNLNPIESIRQASQRWGSDFFELVDIKYKEYNPNPIRSAGEWNGFTGTKTWQIIWSIENFSFYDRILFLDTDIFINSKAPNIFNLLEDFEIACVKDGNPGRLDNAILNMSRNFVNFNNCISYFDAIPNFNKEKYYDNYFNTGVVLLNPKKILDKVNKFKELILVSKLKNYIEEHNSPIDQNLISAWVSSDLDFKVLDNTWNWTCPDISQEYDDFLGEMKPFIYHFCGTNLIKDRIENYNRWK